MKEKIKNLPEALQKQVIIRLGASIASLLLAVAILAVNHDLYLTVTFIAFWLFFGINGTLLIFRLVNGKYVVIEGRCNEVERTVIRKKPKSICFLVEDQTVKLQIRQKMRDISIGDFIRVYVADNTPVYQDSGCQILGGYLAIEIEKGCI